MGRIGEVAKSDLPKSQSAEAWLEEMKDVPCYRPCPPFYDFCNNMNNPFPGFNCDRCFEEHDLMDCIE